jgi:transposase-like protein
VTGVLGVARAELASALDAGDLLVGAASGRLADAVVGGGSLHGAHRAHLAATRRIGDHRAVHNRPLPADLVAVLRRTRAVELAADTRAQLLDAVRATAVLAAAARDEGWTVAELAGALGIKTKTLRWRLRQHAASAHGGLVVTPAPPARAAAPLPPLERREWLTRSEAIAATGASSSAIGQWLAAGLLPSTIEHGTRRYARSDLERVLAATERDGRGVRWSALRAQLEANR